VVHPSHVFLALPLVAVILVRSPGDGEYHTEGRGWVVDCGLVGLVCGLYFYLLLRWLSLLWWGGGRARCWFCICGGVSGWVTVYGWLFEQFW
jgi:hypothetical protein